MYWNYRVTKEEHGYGYCIVEVFYDDDGSVDGWSQRAVPFGETVDELRDDLRLMLIAFEQPVFEPPEE